MPRSMDGLSQEVGHRCVSRCKNLVPLHPEAILPGQEDTSQVCLQPAHAVPVLQAKLQPWPSPPLGIYFHLTWCHPIPSHSCPKLFLSWGWFTASQLGNWKWPEDEVR